MATSGKPSTWFPLGELVEQSPPPADIFAAVHFTSSSRSPIFRITLLWEKLLLYELLEAGGKPSTRFPPGGLVEPTPLPLIPKISNGISKKNEKFQKI